MNQVVGFDMLGDVFAVILAEDGDFILLCFIDPLAVCVFTAIAGRNCNTGDILELADSADAANDLRYCELFYFGLL
ncbi:hypothetical protein JYP49_02570 [Nitratireductor aquimarinus]|uniref:hypothetical protein n=1 Tax=Nitratireductor TaxID=245876 RepID=UPI0019D37B0A|nr:MULTISPECIES: hypothetical protein [Nitratireductor]MBN7776598.1 hypothetical protein [Nitratireductor pacificus]MBN7779465.1 hypothetical protein [Nitratireductor pacificus]MBN7788272.1 hypothetical protein [Nitratireductor aquimarinus]MBY6098319.1 hypothetical protein [Nitratireductor aquimarinus]MCA1261003.1 hypothetical protein [Nitratireductor aquimarinus]